MRRKEIIRKEIITATFTDRDKIADTMITSVQALMAFFVTWLLVISSVACELGG